MSTNFNRATAPTFALDSRALSDLKSASRSAPEQALKQAASQFEAVFMNMLLKSMRESVPQDGALDSDATRTYVGLLDQQLAQQLSGKGMGLADLIVKQLSRQGSGISEGAAGGASNPSKPEPAAENRGVEKPDSSIVSDVLQRLRSRVEDAVGSQTAPRAAQFVREMLPHARLAEQATGIPARFVLAQAALESAWGRSEPRGPDGKPSNNLFGIKAGPAWSGSVVEARTIEYVNGSPRTVVQRFRAYETRAESFADYARLISGSPRYKGVLAQGTDASGFAQALQKAGYATDPRYAEKIAQIISRNFGAQVS